MSQAWSAMQAKRLFHCQPALSSAEPQRHQTAAIVKEASPAVLPHHFASFIYLKGRHRSNAALLRDVLHKPAPNCEFAVFHTLTTSYQLLKVQSVWTVSGVKLTKWKQNPYSITVKRKASEMKCALVCLYFLKRTENNMWKVGNRPGHHPRPPSRKLRW